MTPGEQSGVAEAGLHREPWSIAPAVTLRGEGFSMGVSSASAERLAAELRQLARPPALSATTELATLLSRPAPGSVELGPSHRTVVVRALEHLRNLLTILPGDLQPLFDHLRQPPPLTYRLVADGLPSFTSTSCSGTYYLPGDRLVDEAGRAWLVESTQTGDHPQLTLKPWHAPPWVEARRTETGPTTPGPRATSSRDPGPST